MPYEESIPFLLHRTGFANSGASLDFLPSDLLKPARALVGLAHVAARQNRQEQARSLAQDSLDLFTQLEDAERYRIIQWLEELALISE